MALASIWETLVQKWSLCEKGKKFLKNGARKNGSRVQRELAMFFCVFFL